MLAQKATSGKYASPPRLSDTPHTDRPVVEHQALPARAGHEEHPARTTPRRPHTPARLRDWNSAAQARGTRPLPRARHSALTRAGGEPARLRGRLVGAGRQHQRASLVCLRRVGALSRRCG